eukprot:851809-Amphidinium_carterae.1
MKKHQRSQGNIGPEKQRRSSELLWLVSLPEALGNFICTGNGAVYRKIRRALGANGCYIQIVRLSCYGTALEEI